MTTTTVTAFIPAQRPASDPVTAPAPAGPVVPAPSIPGPRTLATAPGRAQTATAAAPAAGVWLPRTAAERRTYAIEVAASGGLEAAIDVATFQVAQRTAAGRKS